MISSRQFILSLALFFLGFSNLIAMTEDFPEIGPWFTGGDDRVDRGVSQENPIVGKQDSSVLSARNRGHSRSLEDLKAAAGSLTDEFEHLNSVAYQKKKRSNSQNDMSSKFEEFEFDSNGAAVEGQGVLGASSNSGASFEADSSQSSKKPSNTEHTATNKAKDTDISGKPSLNGWNKYQASIILFTGSTAVLGLLYKYNAKFKAKVNSGLVKIKTTANKYVIHPIKNRIPVQWGPVKTQN